MIILKLLGVALIALVGLCVGLKLSSRLKSRAEALLWYSKASRTVAEKISLTGAELYDILNTVMGREKYIELKKPFFAEPMKNTLQGADLELVYEFFSELGMGDIESQIERCRMYSQVFYERHKQAAAEFSNKARLYRLLGLFAGLSFGIVII